MPYIRFRTLVLVAFLLAISAGKGYAQTTPLIGGLMLSGKVVDETKHGLAATVYVYRGDSLLSEFRTSKIGKFDLEVALHDSITFVVCEDNYVSKTIVVDSRVHQSVQHKNFVFPFFIDLYPVGRVPSHIDLSRPVGKIVCKAGQFIYDTEFTKHANEELKEFIRERKDMKVRIIEN